jgi:DNA-directed RNA polymerase specialized sigma24 family protein
MNTTIDGKFLTEIVTDWQMLRKAQESWGPVSRQARGELAERYLGAVQRYLLSLLPQDPSVAGEIASNLALGFLEGAPFLRYAGRKQGSTTRAGSFRAYLKQVLRNKVRDYYRQAHAKRQPRPLPPGVELPAGPATGPDGDDRGLEAGLKAELLDRAWDGLFQEEQTTGQPYYTLLRFRTEHADRTITGKELAARLQMLRGKPFTANHVHQLLHRARILFARLVVREVVSSLRHSPADLVEPAAVEQELIDLGLLNAYVKKALEEYTAWGPNGPVGGRSSI